MKIDVMNWKPFLIGKMFDIHPTKAYKNLSKEELNDGGTTPFVVNSAENNGIGGFSTLEATEQGGIITFSDTTDGNTFFINLKVLSDLLMSKECILSKGNGPKMNCCFW